MTVEPRTAVQNDSNSGGLLGAGGSDAFLQLLMTQLKSQDPMSPMDTNQFVTQLVQFNTLDQITCIRELMQAWTSVPPAGEQ
jgi:flagellar basal-body rod modification protein FlgD